MKLKKIKLSGFKSFVDPTIFHLPSNLTGVVGPNGCGKSNIIDAVRWVMGEISAKQLRGESMSDVIFNGSAKRQPVGRAMVELFFDNSDASLGGQYAQYGEISVRREVSREGFSDYFFNNSSCRRKDIIDVFLGTGLGPSSYAIIEQGMISQFIEAKPDELRVVIEEAAGISKYKERRRETENRIKHTKENLLRLNDILDELNQQLKHLKSQAAAAERYRKLKQEERLVRAELHTLHWRDLNKKLGEQETAIKSGELELEEGTTEIHLISAKTAELREKHHSDLERFNEVQASYYKIGANITRLEQQLQYTKERREQLTAELAQINQVWQETTLHQTTDQNQLDQLIAEKTALELGLTQSELVATASQQELQLSEQQMQLWQNNWDDFNLSSAKTSQLVEVEQLRITHLEKKILEEQQNLAKLHSEFGELDLVAMTTEMSKLNNLFVELKDQRDKLHENVVTRQQQITAERESHSKLALELNQTRNKLQTLIGRQSSLEALQQAALGKNDTILIDWLKQQQLAELPRLAEKLQVVAGWETAVETVLGVYLEAICVDGVAAVAPAVKSLTHGSLTLFASTLPAKTAVKLKFPTLASKITSDLSIGNLLQGIYVAENITEALEMQSKVDSDESIITTEGVWLGLGWLRVAYDTNPKVGILQRERELQELHSNLEIEKQRAVLKEQELEKQQSILVALENEHSELQQQLHLLTVEYSEMQSQITAKNSSLEHLSGRARMLKQELETRELNLGSESEQLEVRLKTMEELVKEKALNDAKRQTLLQNRDQEQQNLTLIRVKAKQTEKELANLKMRLQLLQTQADYLSQNLTRANQRLSSLEEQRLHVESALVEIAAPLANLASELQLALQQRLLVESELTLAKQQTAELEQKLRDLEQQHSSYQTLLEQIRGFLEKLRTERQGLQVRRVTYEEQVVELGLKLDDLNAAIPEDSIIATWEEKLINLAAKIDRLGLINLAAIDEFTKLEERKNYLEAQNQDLVSALNTLAEAMRRIDYDTRERFKDAYDRIDQEFQVLFPKIFNGGKAYLAQTGDNLLEAGVMIMAEPPGKRNSSIHLLSGGEKALTAIALIFSIFQLNPAPFCMLDEVDAPLDDLNVLRFCNIVKEMGRSVQFIFVTHNKLTMEIAEQLLGVTMQEAGVSRIVTVDINTAISMTGAEK